MQLYNRNELFFNSLTKRDQEKTYELVHEALGHSAHAFSKFLGKNVAMTITELNEEMDTILPDKDGAYFSVLSDIKGDIKGKCYLLFSMKDVEELVNHTLPAEYKESHSMREAVITELDNILTASVISKICDNLRVHAYAYVPILSTIKGSEVKQLLTTDHDNNCLVFSFNASFAVDDIELKPVFIWVVEKKFLDLIVQHYGVNSAH